MNPNIRYIGSIVGEIETVEVFSLDEIERGAMLDRIKRGWEGRRDHGTGMKDKGGVGREMFENDRVQNPKGSKGTVKWDKHGYWYVEWDDKHGWNGLLCNYELEIIGREEG